MDTRSHAKFETEKGRVALLMRRLGQAVDGYEAPNCARGAAGESGADVVVASNGRRVGVQVTELDTGNTRGQARDAEIKLARDAASRGDPYSTWAQNDLQKVLDAVVSTISHKARMSFSGFDEFWLLVCCGVPTSGAIGSTFVMTPWIDVGALDTATLSALESSKYSRAFIHAILGVEEQALYEWHRGVAWSKSTVPVPPEEQGPDFWIYKHDPELLSDPVGWSNREVKRYFAERQNKQAGEL